MSSCLKIPTVVRCIPMSVLAAFHHLSNHCALFSYLSASCGCFRSTSCGPDVQILTACPLDQILAHFHLHVIKLLHNAAHQMASMYDVFLSVKVWNATVLHRVGALESKAPSRALECLKGISAIFASSFG
ncbi:unnamed protein product [Citrullus colocynthis]|uniref:Secreted protein n=1 Tax=Citrullus colocynthis TaxID=252529 RepID=A0ABP0Y0C1_9ROSI